MLPAAARLRRREEFTRAMRSGRSGARDAIVVHAWVSAPSDAVPRVGFVVPRAVGGAVVRNRVRRRLRELMRRRLDELPRGAFVVVRARPAAATVGWAELEDALRGALTSALRRWSERAGTAS